MAEQQTETKTTARRGRPAGASKTAASTGNAQRRQKPSLSGRMGILERKVNQQNALLHKIARGVT
jgi:hypothetical protein